MAIFDTGKAPITSTVKDDIAKVPRSAFNMSRVVNTNGIIGALMPIDILETIPNEDYTLNYGALITTRNPMVRKMNNGMKVYFHSYWCPKRELWKGWDNYLTKGRSGTVENTVPKLFPVVGNDKTLSLDYQNGDKDTRVPFAPSSYMGLPIANFGDESTGAKAINKFTPAVTTTTNVINNSYSNNKSGAKWEITALPFVMYNKIFRDYYMNQNLVQGNKKWFPDDEDEWILPYNCEWANTNTGLVKNTAGIDFNDTDGNVYVPTGHGDNPDQTEPFLNMLHFRSYIGDYFTTANPFEDLLRGDKSLLNLDVEATTTLSEISAEITNTTNADDVTRFVVQSPWAQDDSGTISLAKRSFYDGYSETRIKGANEDQDEWINKALKKLKVTSNIALTQPTVATTVAGISLNNLRKAVVLEKYMQRMATTNGTYREMVGQMFGYKPNVYDRKPRYIGGSVQPIQFNEVVQTGSTTGSEYLGKTASRGIAAGNFGIGKFHSDDYGYIMTIASIVPDTYYAQQGIETMWTRTSNAKEYIPLSNNLEPQPILEKELYVGDKDHFEDVFGWTERNADLKSRRNIITGLGACGNKAIFDSYNFMRREFDTAPTFNAKFLTMSTDNIDMKPFASVAEPPFDMMIGCNIDKVSPIPYTSKPADLGIKY